MQHEIIYLNKRSSFIWFCRHFLQHVFPLFPDVLRPRFMCNFTYSITLTSYKFRALPDTLGIADQHPKNSGGPKARHVKNERSG
jgi:hypothetical protein